MWTRWQQCCEASHLGLPEPYLVETPVVLKSNEDSAVSVATRQIGVFLPHDWFARLGWEVIVSKKL